MSDIMSTRAAQLHNIEIKTGKSFLALCRLIADSQHTKVSEQRAWLMATLGLGYGDANTLALCAKEQGQVASGALVDPLDGIYSGSKAHLRSLHELVARTIQQFGPHEQAPKKNYVSFRRKKQFAMLGPATKDSLELGLNAKQLPPAARLRAARPGGMCQYTVRLSTSAEVDAEFVNWLRVAYAAAGQ